MIIRETDREFVLITQHDHARLAGEIASHLEKELFLDDEYLSSALLAIDQHDRGWIPLDASPIWNAESQAPYSFMDYPLAPKIEKYQQGLDEVEAMNEYAALLCSLHYASFMHIRDSLDEVSSRFYQHELARQQRITEKLSVPQEVIHRHFMLLQLCDDISLYVCLNEPGVSKEEEHPWFREGFEATLLGERCEARWGNAREIRLTPPILAKELTTTLPVRQVSKRKIETLGFSEAYKGSECVNLEISLLNG
ncbi:DUF3891 family protein [Paenibacillus sp. MBLB2552]|uniref:DUF3891 family protein n=1 Tax=Paenibacillus mellifer TaxID=2937794 RepID=A0A9X1XZC1_9BACL|nr:DUF3891 family protein [Paenibacillus mellifer]MCK8487723.1 DUF3891 family protein [Paenibacillus mellifer]